MTTEYKITLIPMLLEDKVIYKGKDYTTSAQKHNVELDGRKFYVRQNSSIPDDDLLKRAVESSLREIVSTIKPFVPLTISLTLEE